MRGDEEETGNEEEKRGQHGRSGGDRQGGAGADRRGAPASPKEWVSATAERCTAYASKSGDS